MPRPAKLRQWVVAAAIVIVALALVVALRRCAPPGREAPSTEAPTPGSRR